MEKKTKIGLLVGCLGLPLALVLICLGGAFMLPSKGEVARSITINGTPEQIHPHVASFQAWEAWSPWVEDDPEMTMEYSGPEIGVGNKLAFSSPEDGDGTMEVTKADPSTGVTYTMQMADFELVGEFAYEPDGDTTTLVWTDHLEYGNNPVFRLMGAAIESVLGPFLERGLDNIKREVEKGAAAPVVADPPKDE